MSLLKDFGFIFARQWIGGTTVDAVTRTAKRTNRHGERVVLNYLGEAYSSRRETEKSVRIYLELLHKMKDNKIEGSISVKPTQLGILVSDSLFMRNYEKIVRSAADRRYFVWMDMEEYEYVDRVIRAYLRLFAKHKNIGICLQAKLKRSLADAKRIAKRGGAVRIVKGAYAEPKGVFYSDREELRRNYLKMMEVLLKESCSVMIATHDDYLVYKAVNAEKKYNSRVSFGMLKGIRGKLAQKLADSGENMNIYTPFGEEWVKYTMRRLQEEGHALLILRSVFQQ